MEHCRYLLQQAGVAILSVTEPFLADEGIAGDVLRAVKHYQNRSYSVSLSQVTPRGQISAVLKASEPGRRTPYGYDREVLAPGRTIQYRFKFMTGGDRLMLSEDGRVIGTYGPRQTLRKPGKESGQRPFDPTPTPQGASPTVTPAKPEHVDEKALRKEPKSSMKP